MFGSRGIGGDEGQVYVGLSHRREFHLGFLGSFLETLQRHPIFPEIDTLVLLELIGEIIDDLLVEILTTEEGIAIGRFDLEHAVADFENRNIESTAAQVEDRDLFVLLLVESISERCGSRLIDDAQNIEARDASRILGSLALIVTEISRHRDDRLGTFSPR